MLPLQSWPASVSGLAVYDGGIDGGPTGISGLTGQLDTTGEVDTGTFTVCNTDDELRISLVWLDPAGDALVNDLNLEVLSPGGTVVYRGNYFTDDDNRDGTLDPFAEDCPGIDGATGTLSETPWSLPVCQRGDTSIVSVRLGQSDRSRDALSRSARDGTARPGRPRRMERQGHRRIASVVSALRRGHLRWCLPAVLGASRRDRVLLQLDGRRNGLRS